MSSAAHWLVLGTVISRKRILSTQESGHFNTRTLRTCASCAQPPSEKRKKYNSVLLQVSHSYSETGVRFCLLASQHHLPLSSSRYALPILLPMSSLGGKRSSSHCGLPKDRDGKVTFQLTITNYSISAYSQVKFNILLVDTAWNTSSVGRQAWPLWMEIKARHSVRRLEPTHV